MKIIHHFQTTHRAGVFDKGTACGIHSIQGLRGAYTLGDATKRLEHSPESVLCAPCFYLAVGNIRFDQEPSYGEELQNYIKASSDEIVDAEEL